jgi:glycosyltransferase involved in cell wall biosynthesis
LERDRGVTKRVLVLDATTPEPDKDAGSLTCFEIIRAIQAIGYKVSFLAESNLLFLRGPTGALQRMGVEVGYYPYVESVDAYLKAHRDLFDVVVIFRNGVASNQLGAIRKHCPSARVIFHCSDLHFVREERHAELTEDQGMRAAAQKTKRKELAIIAAADASIVHSHYEQEVLAREAPKATVEVFPWILDPKGPVAPFSERNDIAFLGGYRHSPNVDAVRYFVESIWPAVRQRIPDAKFIIAGSDMPPELAALHGRDNIIAAGYVADLDGFFSSLRLSVAPIRYGAGIKGKVAVSLAHGVPCVVTGCAAEGMGLVDGEAVIIRDAPEEFAEQVATLYGDDQRWTRMSSAGLRFVEKTYGSELGRSRMREIFDRAGVRPG